MGEVRSIGLSKSALMSIESKHGVDEPGYEPPKSRGERMVETGEKMQSAGDAMTALGGVIVRIVFFGIVLLIIAVVAIAALSHSSTKHTTGAACEHPSTAEPCSGLALEEWHREHGETPLRVQDGEEAPSAAEQLRRESKEKNTEAGDEAIREGEEAIREGKRIEREDGESPSAAYRTESTTTLNTLEGVALSESEAAGGFGEEDHLEKVRVVGEWAIAQASGVQPEPIIFHTTIDGWRVFAAGTGIGAPGTLPAPAMKLIKEGW